VAAKLVHEVDELRRVDHLQVARPGRILAERRVDLPRPRDPEAVYTPAFVDLLHELRGHLAQPRK